MLRRYVEGARLVGHGHVWPSCMWQAAGLWGFSGSAAVVAGIWMAHRPSSTMAWCGLVSGGFLSRKSLWKGWRIVEFVSHYFTGGSLRSSRSEGIVEELSTGTGEKPASQPARGKQWQPLGLHSPHQLFRSRRFVSIGFCVEYFIVHSRLKPYDFFICYPIFVLFVFS